MAERCRQRIGYLKELIGSNEKKIKKNQSENIKYVKEIDLLNQELPDLIKKDEENKIKDDENNEEAKENYLKFVTFLENCKAFEEYKFLRESEFINQSKKYQYARYSGLDVCMTAHIFKVGDFETCCIRPQSSVTFAVVFNNKEVYYYKDWITSSIKQDNIGGYEINRMMKLMLFMSYFTCPYSREILDYLPILRLVLKDFCQELLQKSKEGEGCEISKIIQEEINKKFVSDLPKRSILPELTLTKVDP